MVGEESVAMAWADFPASTLARLKASRGEPEFADVTLACEGEGLVPAHRIVLSAGSSYFQSVLRKVGGQVGGQVVLFLRGVEAQELEAVLAFLYEGQARVERARLPTFLTLASQLGLTGFAGEQGEEQGEQVEEQVEEQQVQVEDTTVQTLSNNAHIKQEKDCNTDTKPKSSGKVWNFAQKLDEHTAKCNYCGEEIKSFKGDRMAVKMHLLDFHSSEPGVAESITIKSPAWKFFTKIDMLRAACNLCNKVFSVESHLGKHLNKCHGDNPEVMDAFASKKNLNKPKSTICEKRTQVKTSPVWGFITKESEESASCNLCNCVMGIKGGSTSTARKHLLSQHAENFGIIEAFENSRKRDEEIEQPKTVRYFHGRSPVWQFSERLGEERAKCKLCGKCFNLPGKSTKGIRNHFLKSHMDNTEVVEAFTAREDHIKSEEVELPDDFVYTDNGLEMVQTD